MRNEVEFILYGAHSRQYKKIKISEHTSSIYFQNEKNSLWEIKDFRPF